MPRCHACCSARMVLLGGLAIKRGRTWPSSSSAVIEKVPIIVVGAILNTPNVD